MLTRPPLLNLQAEEDVNNAASCSDHSAPGLMCIGLSNSGSANMNNMHSSKLHRNDKKKSPKSVRSMPCHTREVATFMKRSRSISNSGDH